MFYKIIKLIVFNFSYSIDDKSQVDCIKQMSHDMNNPILYIQEIFPFLRSFYFYKKIYNQAKDNSRKCVEIFKQNYQESLGNFDSNEIKTFADALIFSKKEAEEEEKDSSKYLNDDNLALVLAELFIAGFHTTQVGYIFQL